MKGWLGGKGGEVEVQSRQARFPGRAQILVFSSLFCDSAARTSLRFFIVAVRWLKILTVNAFEDEHFEIFHRGC